MEYVPTSTNVILLGIVLICFWEVRRLSRRVQGATNFIGLVLDYMESEMDTSPDEFQKKLEVFVENGGGYDSASD